MSLKPSSPYRSNMTLQTPFHNLVRRGVIGGAGWCRNIKAKFSTNSDTFEIIVTCYFLDKLLTALYHRNSFLKTLSHFRP